MLYAIEHKMINYNRYGEVIVHQFPNEEARQAWVNEPLPFPNPWHRRTVNPTHISVKKALYYYNSGQSWPIRTTD